ncbi:MAG: right-handed parallel beta-helix repeat-containing protein [Planctomycetota bacterium]
MKSLSLTDTPGIAAVANGTTDDAPALNAALQSLADQGGGILHIPPGDYRCSTVYLQSHVHLHLAPGARLIGSTDPNTYDFYKRPPDNPEGQGDRWHRALILGQDIEDVVITGGGTIDGGGVRDPNGEENERGPHTVVLGGCKNIRLDNLTLDDSGNYAVLTEYSDDLEFRNLRFRGGWDGIHARGMIGRPCRNMTITQCDFQTGDDAIAGRYWDRTLITHNLINSACNGIRVIGPAEHLTIAHNHFHGPGRYPHITQSRYNALAGIILQPGAWDVAPGPLDHVLISHNTMTDQQTPLCINTEAQSPVGSIHVDHLTATQTYGCALALEGLPDQPLQHLSLHDINVTFTKDAARTEPVELTPARVGVRPTPAWGLFARHINHLDLTRVRMHLPAPDVRPAIDHADVPDLQQYDCRFTTAD